MDNHPIPQDITGFEFKLIGDMTIKQFAYLATGSVLAYLTFSLPIFFLIKIPLTSFFVIFGISFAFLSIGGRPIDVMIINYLRATFNPTQYVYQQQTFATNVLMGPVQNHPTKVSLHSPIEQQVAHPQNKLDKKEFDFFKMLGKMLTPAHTTQQYQPPKQDVSPHIITAEEDKKGEEKEEEPAETEHKEETEKLQEKELDQETLALQQKLQQAKLEEAKDLGTPSYENAHEKVLEIEKLLSETLSQKQNLERELLALKKQLAQQTKSFYTPTETPNVRTLSEENAKSAGIPNSPMYPNLISGIIKDPRGNPLPNILVEVKDPEGNPVRAFKTSGLGNFSASTPLVNGTYTIEFEDPKGENKFDSIQFTADGNIILPLEIISVDQREELRRTLFTQKN